MAAGAGGESAAAAAALLVFGDSLSDVGNAYQLRGDAAFPCPPHWRGRRCDGPLWVEGLAQGLGLPPLGPSLLGGQDHAFGGARSGAGLSPKGMPNLLEQVGRFLVGSSQGGEIQPAFHSAPAAAEPCDPASTLVVLRAGANDYLDRPPGPALASAVNANLLEAVRRMASAGFRRFLVPSELPWGHAPIELPGLDPPQRLALNALIAQQNQALRRSLDALAAERGLLVVQPDFEALMLAVRCDPAGHGFRQLERPALAAEDPEGAARPADVGGWLWWDSWGHLGSSFHRLLAERALESLHEAVGQA